MTINIRIFRCENYPSCDCRCSEVCEPAFEAQLAARDAALEDARAEARRQHEELKRAANELVAAARVLCDAGEFTSGRCAQDAADRARSNHLLVPAHPKRRETLMCNERSHCGAVDHFLEDIVAVYRRHNLALEPFTIDDEDDDAVRFKVVERTEERELRLLGAWISNKTMPLLEPSCTHPLQPTMDIHSVRCAECNQWTSAEFAKQVVEDPDGD